MKWSTGVCMARGEVIEARPKRLLSLRSIFAKCLLYGAPARFQVHAGAGEPSPPVSPFAREVAGVAPARRPRENFAHDGIPSEPHEMTRETLTIVRDPLFSARHHQSFRAKNGRVVVDTPRGE